MAEHFSKWRGVGEAEQSFLLVSLYFFREELGEQKPPILSPPASTVPAYTSLCFQSHI